MAPTPPAPPTAAAGIHPVAPLRSSSSGILLTKLVLRALTIALTFIALLVLTTNTLTVIYLGDYGTLTPMKVKFNDVISYRYMLFTILLGLLYSLLQTALTAFHLSSGKRISNILVYLDFFGDIVLLYALATGAAAGFAISIDLGEHLKDYEKFLAKGNASASMLLLGSICSVVSLVFSSFGLEQRF
uniref:CASP-like protein n=1 Tax=Kalanchoe fedtschenkoi TaxID=63787 RepID=A0A7N0UCL6_KALFE